MTLRTIMAGSIFALLAASALAVPPPPAPLRYTQSWDAIEELSPFIGEWHGTEVQHVKEAGDFAIPAYWRLSRLGGRDVIMLEHGHESKTPASGRESDKPRADQFNILTFSPGERQYKLYLPGYRLFRGSEKTEQLVAVDHADPNSLTWTAAQDDGGGRRTTLTLKGDRLLEAVDQIAPNGAVTHVSDAVLSK